MRWFIALLIVANVILFFWVQQQSKPLPGSASLPPPDVGRLRLLSELEEERLDLKAKETEAPPVEADPFAEPGFSLSTDLETTDLAVDATQSSEAVESDTLAAEAAVVEPEPQNGEQPARQVPVIPEQLVHVAADTDADERVDPAIVAADQSVAQAQQSAAEAVPAEPAAQESPADESQSPSAAIADPSVPAEVAALCARVGPFTPDDANKLISALPAHLSLLSDVAEEFASVDRYYVLIPPLPSRAMGRQKLKELADAGVTDTWLFPSGQYRNAISLGYFSRQSGANRHAANIAKLGFTTEVEEKTSIRERRWLVLRSSDGSDIGTSLPLPAGIRVEQQACP